MWFSTQQEIVAYCYNRDNSVLTINKTSYYHTTYNLTTKYSYNGKLSILFPKAKKVKINKQFYKINKTKDGKEYINVQPINGTIEIKVYY